MHVKHEALEGRQEWAGFVQPVESLRTMENLVSAGRKGTRTQEREWKGGWERGISKLCPE